MAKSIFQPNEAGLPTPQKIDNVHHVADRTHEFEAHKGGNIARAGGKPKVSVVQTHGAMVSRSRMGGVFKGGDDLSRADANPSAPMSKEPGRKNYPAPQVAHGMRSRGTLPHDPALGDAILAEALNGKDHWRS